MNIGFSNTFSCQLPKTTAEYADDLNLFFNRFDKYDFLVKVDNLRISLSSQNDCNWNLITTEEEVRRIFASQNPSKAAGPDKLSPRVLKLCSNQLAYIFRVLHNMCSSNRPIPAIWKKSCIIPVPKKPVISCMNDLRPIALTSAPMKVCERLVLSDLKLKVAPHLDPMQYAYQIFKIAVPRMPILILLELLYSHLERTRFGNSARVMFFWFLLCVTIQPHLLVKKLLDINVLCALIRWTLEYLTNRSQYVKIQGITFEKARRATNRSLKMTIWSLASDLCYEEKYPSGAPL